MAPLTKVSVMAQVLSETCDMGRLHVRNTTTAQQSPDSTRRTGIVRDKDISHLSLDVHSKRAEKDTVATNVAFQLLPALANSAHIIIKHDGGTTVHEEPEEPEAPYGALHAGAQAQDQVQVQGRMVTGTGKTTQRKAIHRKNIWRVTNDRVTNGHVRIPYLGIRNVTNVTNKSKSLSNLL